MLFYQFQYREYNNNEQVKSFNPRKMKADEEKELNKLVKLWNYDNREAKSFYGNNIKNVPSVFQLKPGQSFTIAEFKKGGRVLGIEFDPGSVFEGLHKQVDLKITWDDEKIPAVYAPVADLFGYAFGARSMRSLLMGVNYAGKAYCYIPMPFEKAAKLELVYRGGISGSKPLDIHSVVYYTDEPRRKEEGRFYVNWKREDPPLGKPYAFLEGKGKGHYIGTVLHSQATDFITFTEFFEGDDLTVIDGEMTAHGTGSEDYFNGGWYAQPGGWVERLGTQLHGCLDYSLSLSRTGGYRFFISDKMPFNKSIFHSIEHGPVDNNREVDYIFAALYYAEAPVQQSMTPTNALTSVLIPDTYTFYSRLMDYLSYEKDISYQNWNSEFNGQEGIMRINVTDLPAGNYKLFVHAVSDTPEEVQIGIKQKNGNISWTKVSKVKDRTDVFIGSAEVLNTKLPIEVFFKSDKKNKLIFNKVLFKK